jgi:signal transduction histidine kinase/ligand-binding sensor domain-containing protein
MSIRRPVIRRATVCLRVLLLISISVSTARAQYRFDHWTADTGLPQNIIIAIQQTPEGYLWVATLDGLARFDGVRFTVFNKSNTPGISSNRFTCLYQDAQGDLWAGTEVGVVTRYHQGQFITYTTEHGLLKNVVTVLMGDQQEPLWVYSGNKIREWEPAAGRFIEREAPTFSGGSGSVGWSVEGGIWGVEQGGLHLLTRREWTHLALPAEAGGQITQMAKEEDGAIWIVAAGGRTFRLKDGKVTAFPHWNQQPRAARPLTEWRDRSGKIWEMEIVQNLLRKLTIPSSGQPETITLRTFYEDRDGNLWLGTEGQGLYRIRKQIVTTYSKEQGLIGRNVYPVYEDRAGAIWVGAWDGGLSQIKAGKITNFTTRDGLSAGAVTAFCEDRAGRLWIATHTDLQTFEQGRFTSVKAQYTPGQTMVNVIYQDQMGAMWFGADDGLFRHHNGRTQHFTPRDGLPGKAVRVIIEAAAGGVWVGCSGGLMRWRDGKITAWTEQDGLPGNTVRALYEDQDGALWIGTYDSGLGRFKDGKFTRYTTREGLFNDGVFQILEDAYGYLWMSSNRGIYRVRKQELNEFAAGERREITSIAFGKNDGMLNVECNGGLWPAGVRSRDGRLWFPTQDGVAMIDPAAVTMNQQPPPVLIEAVLLDRAPVAFRDEVRLQPGQGNLEIQYTALSFANAAFSRFKYKLEGLDGDWVDAGTRRAAFFSYLPPGEYVFKVIAANSDGVWNMEGQSLRITALPPFYRTWWFLTLGALAVSGAVFVVFKYRVRQLEQRQAAQRAFARQLIESQEAERQRIAAELHDSLGQNLLIIKNRALLGQLAAEAEPQFSEQFEQLAASAEQSVEEVREIARNLRPYHLDRLGLTEALEDMIEKVAASTAIRLVPELVPLDGLFSKEAAITLYRVVQESLNNVVKHSQASEARISIERQSDSVTITITDNGRGFAPPRAEAKPIGFGLAGMAERVRILGGELSIHSREGQGTTVRVRIELKSK